MNSRPNLPAGSKLVFSNQEISSAIDELALRLNTVLKDKTPVVLCVMQGGLIFSGQLIPRLDCMLEIDYLHVTRYNNGIKGGALNWKAYPVSPLKDRVVLILDDILDEGKTLKSIVQYCEQQGAKQIESAVLLHKIHTRCIDMGDAMTENIALTVEDRYVFGFGMDYNGEFRQLDSIYALESEKYK